LALRKSAIIEKAQKLVFKGLFRQAIKEWQRLLSETPNDGNIFNAIGDLHLKTGDKDNATASFIKSAEAFRSAGFELKSIALFKKALKVDPSLIEINEKLASVYAERGLIGNAIDDYLKAAKHYQRKDDLRSALSTYRRISQLDTNNENIRMEIAEICQKQGLKQEALEEYKKIMAIYAEKNRTADLDAITKKILEIDPDYYKADEPSFPLAEGQFEGTPEPPLEAPLCQTDSEQSALGFLEPEPSPMAEERTFFADESLAPISGNGQSLTASEESGPLESCLTEADVYLKYGLTEKAIERFEEGRNAFPSALEPHLQLKDLYIQQGNLEKAIKVCSDLARLYQEKNEPERQEAALNELMALEAKRGDTLHKSDEPPEPEIVKEGILLPEHADIPSTVEAAPEASGEPFSGSTSLAPALEVEGDSGEEQTGAPQIQVPPSTPAAAPEISQGLDAPLLPENTNEETIPSIDLRHETGDENGALVSGFPRTPLPREEASQEFSLPEGEQTKGAEAGSSAPQTSAETNTSPQAPPEEDSVEEICAPLQPDSEPDDAEQTQRAPSLFQVEEPSDYVDLQAILSDDLEGVDASSPLEQALREGEDNGNKSPEDQDQEIETQYELGIAYKEMGMLPKAMKAFEMASRGAQRFGDALSMLAACHREAGTLDHAIDLLQKGLSQAHCRDRDQVALKYELAQLYDLQGKVERAFSLYGEVFQIDPGFRDVGKKLKAFSATRSPASPLPSPEKSSSLGREKGIQRRSRVSYL